MAVASSKPLRSTVVPLAPAVLTALMIELLTTILCVKLFCNIFNEGPSVCVFIISKFSVSYVTVLITVLLPITCKLLVINVPSRVISELNLVCVTLIFSIKS